MAWKKKNNVVYDVAQGKKRQLIVLADAGTMGQKNGFHVRFAADTDVETFATTLAGCLDAAIMSYSYGGGKSENDAATPFAITSADIQNAVSGMFTVSLTGGTVNGANKDVVVKILFGKVIKPTKVADIATALKALDYYSPEGNKVTSAIAKVAYKAIV